jgi:hypothetical protein
MIKILAWFFILSSAYIAFEIYRAPLMDDNGRVIKEGKKLRDLFKRKK